MRITTLGWSLCVSGCWLEHVDMVNPAPLDPAFYEAALKSQGQPGQGGGNAIPFSGDDGPKIMVTGTVKAQQSAAIDVDVRVPDSSEQGGVRQEGKVLMDGPGTFELAVPINQGSVVLQAFQDLNADGPDSSDPFAQVELSVGEEDLQIEMNLEVGAFTMGGPTHQEMPHSEGVGQSMGVDPDQPDPFSSHSGSRVTISGTLVYSENATVDLDIWRPSRSAPGGREFVGKMKLATGDYSLEVPEHFGPIVLEAFIDLDGNMGGDPTDPMGAYSGNPLRVGDRSVSMWTLHWKFNRMVACRE